MGRKRICLFYIAVLLSALCAGKWALCPVMGKDGHGIRAEAGFGGIEGEAGKAAGNVPAGGIWLAAGKQDAAIEEETSGGPMGRLIQTTTWEEEYMGMVNCGGTAILPLEEPDLDAAYEKVKKGTVKIDTDGYSGSGVIWQMDENGVTVISNKHLLEHWDKDSFVTFYGGKTAGGEIGKLSEENDLGFLRINAEDVGYEELTRLRAVEKSAEGYENMAEGDILFYVGSVDGTGENKYPGTFVSGRWYIEEFRAYMILGFGYGKPGMSGGGTFDAYGRFIGMVSGGTEGGEVASLPVSVILEEEKNGSGR